MDGSMMDRPLLLKTLLWRAERVFAGNEIVTAIDGGIHRETYAEYGDRVRRLAGVLTQLGIRPGDRVGTLAWNTWRHLEAYYAVPCMGAVLHTINLRLFPEQLAFTINHAGDRVLLVDPDQLPMLEELWPQLQTVEQVIVLDDAVPDTALPAQSYEALLAATSPVADFPDLDERAPAGMCYTSATTGDPKGVVYTHRSMVLHSLAASVHGSFGIREDMTLLAISPMFHANSWGLPHAAVMQGTKIVFPGRHPVADTYLRLVESEKVTHGYGAVTVGIQLRDAIDAARSRYDLSTLQVLLLGGQAPPRGLMEFFDGIGVHVPQAWGMTEASPLATWNYVRPSYRDATADVVMDVRGRQGLPLPVMEVKVADETGREHPWDGETVGELMLRGPWVANGYYRDPERSEAAQLDGWFRTGDIGVIDRDGYVHVLDRSKDLIKSGGEWISSVELENALMTHPDVREAVVVGAPDERWLERPVAYVVARDAAAPPDPASLAAFLGARFAKWWVPDRFELLDDIPKTGVGKFDKKALRARMQA